MLRSDPFYDSVKELNEIIVHAKLVEANVIQKSVVTEGDIAALHDACTAAEDVLGLLQQMLRTIEDKGGRVQGRIFSANEVLERQSTLCDLTDKVSTIKAYYSTVATRRGVQSSAPLVHDIDHGTVEPLTRKVPDEFLLMQQNAQLQEVQHQDEVLDRLTYGLQELRETGVNINGELQSQNMALDSVEHDISGVQVRLRAANAKVDQLLASMSNRGKICTIVILLTVLIFLVVFTLR